MMDLVNFEECSKNLAFRKFKRLLYKYYCKFVKAYKKQPNRLDIRQSLVLLYDCVPSMKNIWIIYKLLKNANVLKSGTCKNSTTALYHETTKPFC